MNLGKQDYEEENYLDETDGGDEAAKAVDAIGRQPMRMSTRKEIQGEEATELFVGR